MALTPMVTNAMTNAVKINCVFDTLFLDVSQAVPAAIILNEFVPIH